MDYAVLGAIFIGIVVLFYLIDAVEKWVILRTAKRTTLKVSMPALEVKKDSITLRQGEELTLPVAIEMVRNLRQLPNYNTEGVEFSSDDPEKMGLVKAVVAVENELAEQQGRTDEMIVLMNIEPSIDRQLVAQVLDYYRANVAPQPAADDGDGAAHINPASIFERPNRG